MLLASVVFFSARYPFGCWMSSWVQGICDVIALSRWRPGAFNTKTGSHTTTIFGLGACALRAFREDVLMSRSFEGGFVNILMLTRMTPSDDMITVCQAHKPWSINLTEANFGPSLIVDCIAFLSYIQLCLSSKAAHYYCHAQAHLLMIIFSTACQWPSPVEHECRLSRCNLSTFSKHVPTFTERSPIKGRVKLNLTVQAFVVFVSYIIIYFYCIAE